MRIVSRASLIILIACAPTLHSEDPTAHTAAEIERSTAQPVEPTPAAAGPEAHAAGEIQTRPATEIAPPNVAAEPEVHAAPEITALRSTTIEPAASTDSAAGPAATKAVASTVAPAEASAEPAPAAVPAEHRANPVEPLSNGLRLSMTQAEIVAKFGEPTEHTFDARTFGYPTFGVSCGGAAAKIWHLTLKGGVKLSSGIGVGSTRAEVERVFGASAQATVGQYALTFRYNGDRVAELKIDPALGEFSSVKSTKGNSNRRAAPPKQKSDSAKSLVGTWYGTGDTKGAIELKADGTYDWSGNPAGRYSAGGKTVTFTGSLAAWNGGVAQLNSRGDTIEFYWTTPEGAKQWFVFVR